MRKYFRCGKTGREVPSTNGDVVTANRTHGSRITVQELFKGWDFPPLLYGMASRFGLNGTVSN